jgi:hypothetical protein
MTDIRLLNNTKCGFTMGPYALVTAGSSNPVSVSIDGMQVFDTPGSNFSWGSPPKQDRHGSAVLLSDSYNLSGSVTMRNVDVRRCYGPALGFENWPNGRVSTLVENLTVANSARQDHVWPGVPMPPIHMDPVGGYGKDENAALHVGGVVFRGCTVHDDRNRDWFSCVWDGTHNHSTPPRLVNISGDMTVQNPLLHRCNADFGNPALGVSPDITLRVKCNPTMKHSRGPAALAVTGSSAAVPLKTDDGRYNVKDYGAKGDGRTDDASAIQHALDRAANVTIAVCNSDESGTSCTHSEVPLYSMPTVIIPPGHYMLGRALVLPGAPNNDGVDSRATPRIEGVGRPILHALTNARDIIWGSAVWHWRISGVAFLNGRNHLHSEYDNSIT